MDKEDVTADQATDTHVENAFKLARFPVKLDLPPGQHQQLLDAAASVAQEYRDGSRWKRLDCRRVSIFAERDRGTVYVLHVDGSVEFDWTWEGATAFCPASFDGDQSDRDAPTWERGGEGTGFQDAPVWSGEIVELDERNGCLFISLDDPEKTPSVGAFMVRPFEFMSVLNAIYQRDEFEEARGHLAARLSAAEGNVHPRLPEPISSGATTPGLPHLANWWQHSWSVLWGPPGTGKTYTTGRQVGSVLVDESERILVVSTTNRATDAVAIAIGDAAKEFCPDLLEQETILRIGKGAAYQSFTEKKLDPMLRGTESDVLSRIDQLTQQLQGLESSEEKALTRKRIVELRTSGNDQSSHIFVDADRRVVIATAFKAMSYLKDETIRTMVEQGEAPFTTVVIDEAGLISRVAVAALSLLASRRVVLVGDSKQLAPISRISRILPTRQQTWLASSGLSHLVDPQDIPTAVHLLSQQWRMHPDVCKVVSTYQYDGVLTTAPDRVGKGSAFPDHIETDSTENAQSPSPFVTDQSRAIWYVLDHEDVGLSSIRAARGPGNRSWVRGVTPIVLQKLFSDAKLRAAKGLFISPFKAQADQIGKHLASWGIDRWEASTVHSQQGSEAEIVIFDTVNAGSGTWPIPEWKRLVNVALSRAREAIIVLASRCEMDEPYLRQLKGELTALFLEQEGDRMVWRNADHSVHRQTSRVAEPQAGYKKVSSCRVGDQFNDRKSLKPILSQEQQRLTNLELDGKPRLVRGVAGSGKSIVLCNWLAKTAKRMQYQKDARIWAVYANRSLHKLLQDSIESAWENLNERDLFDQSEFPWEKVSLMHVKDVLTGILPNGQMLVESIGFDYDRAAEEFLNRHDVDDLLPRCSALFIDEAQDMGPSTLRLLLAIVEQTDESDVNSRSAHLFYDNAQNVYGTKTPKWSDFGLDMRGRSTIMRESFRSTAPITELAVNVLSRLTDTKDRVEQQELFQLGLLESTRRGDEEWLQVRYNEIEGPKPIYRSFDDRVQEMASIASHLKHLIVNDAVSPNDICILYNGRCQADLQSHLAPELAKIGVELSFQRNRSFERKPDTLIATTPHSFKGYESEVVMIPGVDYFVATEGKILASSLYVAMTRARSLLAIYGSKEGSEPSRRIGRVIAECLAIQNDSASTQDFA
ncbi:AAA domain-containing protein [Neorhodopirellula pilleata]|uniref:ATP-dependent RecD-like DNA helicase n=1 Tax=Neorhodopirellula pilleata TaxID=2714738 RepID=A0A5C6AAX9_9BACT|nr:AAA domain-containing protein [Neorhodopirellula pilleata]TWT96315.1 ATP-dependent RecD-like DNA helicase [Neorhodopirellula pilleata]